MQKRAARESRDPFTKNRLERLKRGFARAMVQMKTYARRCFFKHSDHLRQLWFIR